MLGFRASLYLGILAADELTELSKTATFRLGSVQHLEPEEFSNVLLIRLRLALARRVILVLLQHPTDYVYIGVFRALREVRLAEPALFLQLEEVLRVKARHGWDFINGSLPDQLILLVHLLLGLRRSHIAPRIPVAPLAGDRLGALLTEHFLHAQLDGGFARI